MKDWNHFIEHVSHSEYGGRCRFEKLTPALFQEEDKIIRMGVPPMRIEILTKIDGVNFQECYASRLITEIDGQTINLISRNHLRKNKQASARYKDLDDLENLPE